jgi:hypothetical protein
VFVHPVLPSALVVFEIEAPVPDPTAIQVPPPHAILLITPGMVPTPERTLQVMPSLDDTIFEAVNDPPTQYIPFAAMEYAPLAKAAVQFVPSGEVITALFAAAAHKRPFHARARIGAELVEKFVVDTTVHVLVGSAAYWM